MENKKLALRFGIVSLLILIVAFTRLIPHPQNFAPVGAMALFGAAYYNKKYLSFIIPIVAMFLCDLVYNNFIFNAMFSGFVWLYPGSIYTYISFVVIAFIGFGLLNKVKVQNVILSSLLASIAFFLISNFGSWASGLMPYTKDLSGLISCYAAGLPFFRNTIIGDLFYCGILFGAFELIQYKVPAIRTAVA